MKVSTNVSKEARFNRFESSRRLAGISNLHSIKGSGIPHVAVLNLEAAHDMINERIPNLSNLCYDLYKTFNANKSPYSALQFTNVINNMRSLTASEIQALLLHPKQKHVLVDNELLKVVLIVWKPGEKSSIHGHPSGGCIFKVLHGSLKETRFNSVESSRSQSTSFHRKESIAFITDTIGYHAVSNPFNVPAISIHAYTPGKKSN